MRGKGIVILVSSSPESEEVMFHVPSSGEVYFLIWWRAFIHLLVLIFHGYEVEIQE